MTTSEKREIVKDLFRNLRSRRNSGLARASCRRRDLVLTSRSAQYFAAYEGSSRVESSFENLYANVAVNAFEAREFVVEGNRVFVIGRSRGRLKSTGRMFENHWVMSFIVRDGKIANFEEYADTQALAAAHDVSFRLVG